MKTDKHLIMAALTLVGVFAFILLFYGFIVFVVEHFVQKFW